MAALAWPPLSTKSDTEVLVHLHEEEGIEGLYRLRGMFACAIWDSRRRELLLVRDRFGKKPLYYAVLPQGIFFGSELKCLRSRHPSGAGSSRIAAVLTVRLHS
ncbi:MAG TPA: hypothetical protein VEV17_02495 [Bryobacteraceae bacterium]|nr:hypothetical protein [Bryobacteraceae bacterium]